MTNSTVTAARDPGGHLAARRVHLDQYGIVVGPVGHLHEERARLAGLTWEHFDATPLGATVGAELAGVDLTAELPDAVIDELRQALLDYKVIFFRDQPLTPPQHVAFARRFGELEIHPFIPANTGQPELVRFAKSADVGGYENGWHHDVTWRECPSMGAILHALEVPDRGATRSSPTCTPPTRGSTPSCRPATTSSSPCTTTPACSGARSRRDQQETRARSIRRWSTPW